MMMDLNGKILSNNQLNAAQAGDVFPLEKGDAPAGMYILLLESSGQRFVAKCIWK
jgi:hypothetical protein